MKLSLLSADFPFWTLLLRWTALLALAWGVDWAVRYRHARWRLILWRSVLCFGLALPWLEVWRVPLVRIPIRAMEVRHSENGTANEATTVDGPQGHTARTESSKPTPDLNGKGVEPFSALQPLAPRSSGMPWRRLLVMVWAAGVLAGMMRLLRFHVLLGRLRKASRVPGPELLRLADELRGSLGVQRGAEIRLSHAIASPFVYGLWRPSILVPVSLAEQLSERELAALLGHEMAHLCHHDLAWCIGWQWMKTLCWFHPLAWHIPAAHSLACEQEADRIASGHTADRGGYAQSLARLTLRVLTLPPVETELTLNGAAQIIRRLNFLARGEMGAWKWPHSLAGLALVAGLLLATAGWEFSKAGAAELKNAAARKYKEALVVVVDEEGKAIQGAVIQPDGLRVQGIHAPDAYHWVPSLFGPPSRVTTDHEGKAYVKYPVVAFPEEKQFTGKLIFNVVHDEYSTVRIQEFALDGTDNPIHLKKGIHLTVSGYFGAAREAVSEIIPNLSEEGARPEDWTRGEKGALTYHKVSPGGHIVQLMGRLSTGEIVFSEGFDFVAERGQDYHFDLEMKPGIRLEGRIDDQVPRPVTNGRILISVRPKQFPAYLIPEEVGDLMKQYGYFHFWQSYRPLAEDGTFVFESIPPGEVDVAVHGNGFVSRSEGQVKNRIQTDTLPPTTKFVDGPVIGIPQPFPLTAPVTKIEIRTEPTATLELTTTTKRGKPIQGATVYLSPNILRMHGIFGVMQRSNEEPFNFPIPLPELNYSGTTDPSGVAVVSNIPAITRGLELEHAQFQVPLQQPKGWRDRHVRCSFSAGVTNKLALTLEPKGADFIGSN